MEQSDCKGSGSRTKVLLVRICHVLTCFSLKIDGWKFAIEVLLKC